MTVNRARFLRLRPKRMEKTLEQIRLIGNLSDRGNYSYSENEINELFSELEEVLRLNRNRFKRLKSKTRL